MSPPLIYAIIRLQGELRGGDRIDSIQWHPGFYGAAELELSANRADLEFHREFNLSKEPLRMDLLIIKKLTDTVIQNEIGRIFRRYNVVEYKSPDDSLSIDDFYKTIGYACLYKGLGETVNQVPAEELTVSIFRESFPQKMIAALQQSGMAVEERFQGIYYVYGQLPFQTQIVAMDQLASVHQSFRILSRNAEEDDVRAFIEEVARLSSPGDRNNVNAILQVSVAANGQLYEKIRRSMVMCDALRELMKDDLMQARREGMLEGRNEGILEGMRKGRSEGILEGRSEGRSEGILEGRLEGVLDSLTHVMKSFSVDADKAMDALHIPAEERELYRSRLQ